MAESTRLRASVVLAAYAEPLVEGGRVIVFGDALSPLPERLVERGARLVHVYDADPTRVAEAATRNTSRNIAFAPLGDTGIAVREGSFDLAVVENLAHHKPGELLRRVARVLSQRGAALIACPNPEATNPLLPAEHQDEALDYYGLYDAAAGHFEHVRMLGQAPFVGYAVVDFTQTDDPEPSFDAAFIPGGAEDPEWFVALASQRDVALEQFTIVQLPVQEAIDTTRVTELRAQLTAARTAERQARDRMAQVESATQESNRRRRERSAEEGELGRVRAQLAKRDQWLEQLEERATTADARADEAQAQLESLKEELDRAQQQRDQLVRERDAATRERSQLVRDRDAATGERDQLVRDRDQVASERDAARAHANQADRNAEKTRERIGSLEQRLAQLVGIEKDTSLDLERLETQLAERGMEILKLQAALREASRAGRDLLIQLEDARATIETEVPGEDADESSVVSGEQSAVAESPAPSTDADPTAAPPGVRDELERMAAIQAKQEADLAAAEWTIQQLLSQVETTAGPEVADLMGQLHTARVELQRQSVLLQQKMTIESHNHSGALRASSDKASEPDR